MIKNKIFALTVGLLTIIFSANAQQTPAKKQNQSILITGVTAHIGNGSVIENAAIGFNAGKLTYVGKEDGVSKGEYQKLIEANGKHVYPGFIAPNTTLGLVEIDAVKASDDEAEIGMFNPNIRSIIAYNAESQVVESMRPNGVLMAQITPRGGRISGQSSIVQLDAWNFEDATVKSDEGVHFYWPSTHAYSYRSGTVRTNKNYVNQVAEIEKYLEESKEYLYDSSRNPKDMKMDALEGIFNGEKRFYVHTNGAKEMLDAIRIQENLGIKHLVFVGGFEGFKIAETLKDKNIPVLLKRVHSLPNSVDEDVRLPFKVAAELVNAGVLVGLESSGQMERMQTRNLPFYAGTAAGYGISYEQALSTVSLNTAKILGIDDFCGSLEVGKDATLFISEGNALEMVGNRLDKAFIQGRDISLESHQTELYHRYSNKYGVEH